MTDLYDRMREERLMDPVLVRAAIECIDAHIDELNYAIAKAKP